LIVACAVSICVALVAVIHTNDRESRLAALRLNATADAAVHEATDLLKQDRPPVVEG
jgi:hypothetical protein